MLLRFRAFNKFLSSNQITGWLLVEMEHSMNKILLPLLLSTGLVTSLLMVPLALASPESRWTLGASIQRALEVAPEIKAADAAIGKQQGKLEQAGAWPNPSISIQMDETLGLESSDGGYNVTQLEISQALPMGRLTHQRKQAEADVASAQALHHQQRLALEYKVAQRLHILQFAEAKLKLAKKRLQQARRFQYTGRKNDPLIRYLTPLETMRLNIVLQSAKQTAELAEGKFSEAAASFKSLLRLPLKNKITLMPLMPVSAIASFSVMEKGLQQHPSLEVYKQAIASSQAGVAVARSQRFSDPTLSLFRTEEYIANRRQQSMGVMLSVQVPLWNKNNGRVTQARFAVHQAQAELKMKQRNLRTRLYKSHLHLGHLIKQAEHYRKHLLKPAQHVFSLTRKGFKAGELNILTLIDANNTYFDVQARYLELLQQAWLELATVRMSAGISLLDNSIPNLGMNTGGVK